MKFVDSHIKVKSNWFDKGNIFSKVGADAFLLYLTLYRYHIYNQDKCTFATSMKMLKKETGFTIDKTKELFKILIRYKVIQCSVTRWDRYEDDGFMLVTALDLPNTKREKGNKGNEYDAPVTDADHYISIDLKLMQYYLDNGLGCSEIAFYCLIRKYSNNNERKCWMSINKMADTLGFSNDKVHKMVHTLNRMRLMGSEYRQNGTRTINGVKKMSYRFEHVIFGNITTLDSLRESFKSIIDKNIKKWDKQKERKNKVKTSANPFIDDELNSDDIVIEEQEDYEPLNDYLNLSDDNPF
ncbi:helix-turn-helix domain-containing protein [Paenibacillus wynnii]|uniref:helix-turn-helix domain-containing protein n=1 Tax=Paenibacillus wynnii TaxID=268407 RepID=UPI00278D99C0|nr:hypothetical protein [Paenibacillus wynnii]MDQ0193089.1 hypothetical protein [Paenibacillus wynnii]